MPWNNRLREAAYTSPSGERITFGFEDVSRSFDKKGSAFEFPDADGTYIQQTGNTGRRYPLRIFFWGDEYDIEADAFDAALRESGIGKLEHPKYGTIDVVPFGSVTQRDDLKTAANQAVIELMFWETIDLIYPSVQNDPASEVLTTINEYNEETAAEFEEITDLDNAVEQSNFKNSYQSLLDSTSVNLQSIADTQEDVQKQFNAINDSINQGINILISQPLTLAFQTTQLIQAPARALTSIEARLNAYKNLADLIITGDDSIESPGNDSLNSNKFHGNDLYASTYITGSIVSVVNNQFSTKIEALEAAENILQQFDNVVIWRDANFESLGEIDTGGSYQKLQEVVALTAGFLVQISFNLKQERRLTLDRDRTIIDLVAELYGSIDDQLDFFINSNDLSGSQILELPKGHEIVYYI